MDQTHIKIQRRRFFLLYISLLSRRVKLLSKNLRHPKITKCGGPGGRMRLGGRGNFHTPSCIGWLRDSLLIANKQKKSLPNVSHSPTKHGLVYIVMQRLLPAQQASMGPLPPLSLSSLCESAPFFPLLLSFLLPPSVSSLSCSVTACFESPRD
jgi:hypothetical protein